MEMRKSEQMNLIKTISTLIRSLKIKNDKTLLQEEMLEIIQPD